MEAYVTVTDASGRILFRRPATADELAQALAAADDAERNARALLGTIAHERGLIAPDMSETPAPGDGEAA